MSSARQTRPARASREVTARREPGREDPRVTRTRTVVLDAAAALLAERGYTGLTMDALVECTGVSKTTMYKHWPSRTALIVATVRQLTAAPAIPDTGSVRSDLIAMTLDSLDTYKGPRWPGLASVLEAARHDPDLRAALQSVPAAGLSNTKTLLERAVQRGQLRPDIDTATAVTVLVGAIFFRLRLADLPQVKREVPVIIDTVLQGLAPRPGRQHAREG
jgi:AcrR family transcriptional regulator